MSVDREVRFGFEVGEEREVTSGEPWSKMGAGWTQELMMMLGAAAGC